MSCLAIFLGLLPLGVYGDVVRVKILYNKRDSALIQFKEPQHTQTGECILYLRLSENVTWVCTYCEVMSNLVLEKDTRVVRCPKLLFGVVNDRL